MDNVIEIFARLETPGVQRKLFAQLEQKYNYSNLTQDIRKLSTFFQQQNIIPGQRIIISTANTYSVAILFWACLRNGIAAVLLDPEMGPKRARELIDLCEPAHLFLDEKCHQNWLLTDLQQQITLIGEQVRRKSTLLKKLLKKPSDKAATKAGNDLWTLLSQLSPAAALIDSVDSESIAYILFTSGSTATPKAVQISHRALWTNLETVSRVYELDESARIFNILTVYHTDGVIQGPVLSAYKTASWYHPLRFSVRNIPAIFDAVYTYEITHFLAVPTLLHLMNQFREGFEDTFATDTFKHLICSAAPLETAFWQRFEANFGIEIVNVYGLTETIAGTSYCSSVTNSRKVGSVGIPIDCEFKLVDSNDEVVPPGVEGELLIKGDNTLSSYLNNEEATKAAFHDGWFRTGDLAICDTDGIYSISGRKKNLVISGGINIQPEEVIAVLNSHPAVQECACIGLEDEVFGEILVAIIVLQDNEKTDDATLSTYCRTEFEEAKIPKRYYFVTEIPKTGSGKIKYAALKQQILESADQKDEPGAKGDLQTKIIEIAAISFKCPADQIDYKQASTTTLDGWDSLAHLTFVTNLESAFQIHLNAKEIMSVANLVDAERILRNKI